MKFSPFVRQCGISIPIKNLTKEEIFIPKDKLNKNFKNR